jgi:hypothetical protein
VLFRSEEDVAGQGKITDGIGNLTFGGATAFTTIAVSGQSSIVSESAGDTLTMVAGNGLAITTNAGTDTITIATTATGFSSGGEAGGADRTMGNNDNFAIGFETNDINRLNITATGIPQITGGIGANAGTVSTTVSTPVSYNMLSAGPMIIDSGVTVTIGSGGHWTVV